MTPYQWFSVFQTVIMSLVGLLAWMLYRGFQLGRWSKTMDYGPQIDDLKDRMDRAGREMSDLASTVQGWPDKFRADFIPRSELKVMFEESFRDRQRLWSETQNLWKVVRQRKDFR